MSASDNCSFTSNLTGLSSGSTFPVGTTTNVFTATDAAGNASSCSFTVTVNDTEKPTVTCPAPIAVNNTVGLCSAVVYFTVSATDNCAFTANLAGLASGSTFPVGTTTNVFTATDAAGNTALCSFTVTVTDNQKPVITCPTPLSINNTAGTCGAVAMFSVTATDNCSATVSKTSGLASGSTFPVGTTTNVFTATDAAGNTASCNFTVTVNIFADPTLIHAYTVIGVADVKMKSNTVQSGGVGVVNAGEKAKLEQTTLVTAPYTFVKAPVLDLKSGSTVTTYFPGSVSVGILPTFLSNNSPSNNDVNTADNSTQTLPLSSYGKIEVGKNATVIFTGHAQVLIKEIKLREGASLVFSQNTTLLVDKKMDTDKSAKINIAGLNSVQFFVEEDVKIDQNNIVKANIYTQKNLKMEESKDGSTYMTGLFIADKVDAKDNVIWNRSPNGCANSSSSSSSLASNRTFSFDIHAEPTRVQLNWISNQGQNTDYFTIQKFDKNAGLFSDLEIVNNKFADNEQHYYTTYDNNPTEGDNVYRVQMTMNNNKTQLSELKSITFDGLNSVRLFPNPANDIVDMDLSRYSGSDVSVYLYNSFGKQVHFQLLPKVGKQLITLDLGVFDSGTYLVRFAAKGKRDLTKKLMIVK